MMKSHIFLVFILSLLYNKINAYSNLMSCSKYPSMGFQKLDDMGSTVKSYIMTNKILVNGMILTGNTGTYFPGSTITISLSPYEGQLVFQANNGAVFQGPIGSRNNNGLLTKGCSTVSRFQMYDDNVALLKMPQSGTVKIECNFASAKGSNSVKIPEPITLYPGSAQTSSPSYIPVALNPSNIPTTKSSTLVPTIEPSIFPTIDPSVSPTIDPSLSPTLEPSLFPTIKPSLSPTLKPSLYPSIKPTHSSTVLISPSFLPSIRKPSSSPLALNDKKSPKPTSSSTDSIISSKTLNQALTLKSGTNVGIYVLFVIFLMILVVFVLMCIWLGLLVYFKHQDSKHLDKNNEYQVIDEESDNVRNNDINSGESIHSEFSLIPSDSSKYEADPELSCDCHSPDS